ncbi:MAG: metalloregulator ArsR/SmtB family transcription factor [Candidatus Eisenbacteria bacterium]|nr:metalloregulator ArsR/SmtB family transcription factor [Candidatus Eisenbacteria bacterium]
MIKKAISAFKALSDPSRARIFEVLLEGEKNVTEIIRAIGLSQPRVSRHLRILKEAGLVRPRRSGKWVSYQVGGGGVRLLRMGLEALSQVEGRSVDLAHDKKTVAARRAGEKDAGVGVVIREREGERKVSPRRSREDNGRRIPGEKKEIEDFLL